jgi:hypothetical protein
VILEDHTLVDSDGAAIDVEDVVDGCGGGVLGAGCALTADSLVQCWKTRDEVPSVVGGGFESDVECTDTDVCALKPKGSVECWSLGTSNLSRVSPSPTPIEGLTNIVQLAHDIEGIFALSRDGRVFTIDTTHAKSSRVH